MFSRRGANNNCHSSPSSLGLSQLAVDGPGRFSLETVLVGPNRIVRSR